MITQKRREGNVFKRSYNPLRWLMLKKDWGRQSEEKLKV